MYIQFDAKRHVMHTFLIHSRPSRHNDIAALPPSPPLRPDSAAGNRCRLPACAHTDSMELKHLAPKAPRPEKKSCPAWKTLAPLNQWGVPLSAATRTPLAPRFGSPHVPRAPPCPARLFGERGAALGASRPSEDSVPRRPRKSNLRPPCFFCASFSLPSWRKGYVNISPQISDAIACSSEPSRLGLWIAPFTYICMYILILLHPLRLLELHLNKTRVSFVSPSYCCGGELRPPPPYSPFR